MNEKPKKLLDKVRDTFWRNQYAYHTEVTYTNWAKEYILFHNKKHPKDMGEKEVLAFLSCLAKERNVAASTQTRH